MSGGAVSSLFYILCAYMESVSDSTLTDALSTRQARPDDVGGWGCYVLPTSGGSHAVRRVRVHCDVANFPIVTSCVCHIVMASV